MDHGHVAHLRMGAQGGLDVGRRHRGHDVVPQDLGRDPVSGGDPHQAVPVDPVLHHQQRPVAGDGRADGRLDGGGAGPGEEDGREGVRAAGHAHEPLATLAHHLEELGLAVAEIRRHESPAYPEARVRRTGVQQDPFALGHDGPPGVAVPGRTRQDRMPSATSTRIPLTARARIRHDPASTSDRPSRPRSASRKAASSGSSSASAWGRAPARLRPGAAAAEVAWTVVASPS
jgi:hypothetical protein